MDDKLERRVVRLEQPAANEEKWEAQAEARARFGALCEMVREHMGPGHPESVAEYVEKHAPEEPGTDIERVMFVLKDGIQRAEDP